MIEDLLSIHPRNIVRLILPRLVGEPLGPDDPYVTAAKRLARWRRHRILVDRSRARAVRVRVRRCPAHTVCGIVGALELRKPSRRMVLPHEDVIPAIVADRLAMIVAIRANLEPILLVYDGDQATSAASSRKLVSEPPLTDVAASDGTYHRLWSITDAATLHQIRGALQPHQALIADGHHRYAMYQQLRRRHRAVGDGTGAVGPGTGAADRPVGVPAGARARSTAASPRSHCRSLMSPPGFELFEPSEPARCSCHTLRADPGEIVLTDGSVEQTSGCPEPATCSPSPMSSDFTTSCCPPGRSPRTGSATTTRSPRPSTALPRRTGSAILLHPTTVAEVMAVARAGNMMPRKSTSFGPKPRMGLVMRAFDDEHRSPVPGSRLIDAHRWPRADAGPG